MATTGDVSIKKEKIYSVNEISDILSLLSWLSYPAGSHLPLLPVMLSSGCLGQPMAACLSGTI